jgi:antitoxin VapB
LQELRAKSLNEQSAWKRNASWGAATSSGGKCRPRSPFFRQASQNRQLVGENADDAVGNLSETHQPEIFDNARGEEKIVALKIINVYTKSIDEYGGDEMQTAKLFQNGSSQAVRLPKEFRIPGNEVKIFKKGNQVILEPIATTWDPLFESLNEFPDDFMKDGRNQPGMQERESI